MIIVQEQLIGMASAARAILFSISVYRVSKPVAKGFPLSIFDLKKTRRLTKLKKFDEI